MPDPVVDARGVEVEPGDTVIYGFGVGRSVAMAEGLVMSETNHKDSTAADTCPGCVTGTHMKLSLTLSGRLRIRVVRRSYSQGVKPVVDIAPDRVVVLKAEYLSPADGDAFCLPPSPLPTQDEHARLEIQREIDSATECLHDPEANMRDYWEGDTARFIAWHTTQLNKARRKLRELDDGSTAER